MNRVSRVRRRHADWHDARAPESNPLDPSRSARKSCYSRPKYRPNSTTQKNGLPTLARKPLNPHRKVARPAGFEPTTPWFVAKYSIQLSYGRARDGFYMTLFRAPRRLETFCHTNYRPDVIDNPARALID